MAALMAGLCAASSLDGHPPIPPEGQMDCRISVPREMRDALARMWVWSPTFHHQCERLRKADVLVLVTFAFPGDLVVHAAATTTFYHEGSRLTVARTRIARGADLVLYLGHELEHVMENLEHVDFLAEGRRGVTAKIIANGFVETKRAIEAGKLIRLEVLKHPAATTSQELRTGATNGEGPLTSGRTRRHAGGGRRSRTHTDPTYVDRRRDHAPRALDQVRWRSGTAFQERGRANTRFILMFLTTWARTCDEGPYRTPRRLSRVPMRS